jgi:hypothetical protein
MRKSKFGTLFLSAFLQLTRSIGTCTRPERMDKVGLPPAIALKAKSKNERTYDGIDFWAERLVTELEHVVADLESKNKRVAKFSVIGYSLGGLVIRYMLGILHSRQPSFFENVEAVNYMTIASPAIGIPAYNTFWSPVFHFLGSRLLSRSGRQLYTRDRFTGDKPLLEIMANPTTNFVAAIKKFKKVSIYANAVQDR